MAVPYYEASPSLSGPGPAKTENSVEKPTAPPSAEVVWQERMKRARELAAQENRRLEDVLTEADAAAANGAAEAAAQEPIRSKPEPAAMAENPVEKLAEPSSTPIPEDAAKLERMKRARELAAQENRALEDVLKEADAAAAAGKVDATVQERLQSERDLAAMENRLPGTVVATGSEAPQKAISEPERAAREERPHAEPVAAVPNLKISLSGKAALPSPAQPPSPLSVTEPPEPEPEAVALEEASAPEPVQTAARTKPRGSWWTPLRLAFSPVALGLWGILLISGAANALHATHRMKNTARIHFQEYAATYQESRPSLLLSQYDRGDGRREALLEKMVELNLQFGEWYQQLPDGKQKQAMAAMYESFCLLNRLIAMELYPDLFAAEDLNSRSQLRLRLRELERQSLAANTQMEQWDRENQQLHEDFWYAFFHPLSAC